LSRIFRFVDTILQIKSVNCVIGSFSEAIAHPLFGKMTYFVTTYCYILKNFYKISEIGVYTGISLEYCSRHCPLRLNQRFYASYTFYLAFSLSSYSHDLKQWGG
jgi:hypothetical protein